MTFRTGSTRHKAGSNAVSNNHRKEHCMFRILSIVMMLAALISPKAHAAAPFADAFDGPVPDQTPVTFGPIPAQFLTEGGDSLRLDLSTYVNGTITETLRFEASSADTDLVTASLDGSELTLSPGAAGSTQINVTLDLVVDIEISFDVTVLAGSPWSVSDDGNVYLIDGNVGIGVDDPDERLVVNGRIKAEEIHIEDVTPADYVFEEDYDLMSLDELKEHILSRGHLPGIAPGAKMAAEGVSLGRMQTLLLEKVEELMLYTIDQHRTLSVQRRFIDEQERRLASQQRYIDSLEKRLSGLEEVR